tara:strand:- start:4904 stop:5746 length:843 start_codon:yes stop_codon:yes gene_type:complete
MSNSIASSAVLVDLNISVWTARKLDKTVSKEIDIDKNTTTKAGNYNKHLLAGAGELERITKLSTEIRDWHTRQTLPWSDTGTRLLPMTNFFDYKNQLAEYEGLFKERVESFLTNYPKIITVMAYRLGKLFNREDYPDVDVIAKRFNLKQTIMPVPEAGDFRVNVDTDMKDQLENEYQKAYDDRVNHAMNDAWSRVHKTVEHIVERLSGNDKKIFRDSLVDNALDLTQLLTKLNVTKDPRLEQVRVKLEKSLMGVSPSELREHADLRADIVQKVNSIMENV